MTPRLSGKLQPDLYSTPILAVLRNYDTEKRAYIRLGAVSPYVSAATLRRWIVYVYTSELRDLLQRLLVTKAFEGLHCTL